MESLKIPYSICVEPKEYHDYAKVIDENKILKLPENFSEHGKGSIPVRNWVWQHAKKSNAKRYWLLDDNIYSFWRLNKNRHIQVASGTIFRVMEDFVDRYSNIAFAGPENLAFVRKDVEKSPFALNTRIYSCTLILSNLGYRWRGKYNEDTDLMLRALKDGWCTILFKAFTMDKATTMIMKGGNTDTIYNTGDKRKEFAESLQKQHPDVVRVVWKFNRWHHQVDYSGFKKNKLIRKDSTKIPNRVNNYGMVLKKIHQT
jgi:hypothetical protein